MSHFTVIVTKTNQVGIEDQLAPFNEDLTVPSYPKKCYCIGSKAYRRSHDLAKEQLGWDIGEKRDLYWSMPEEQRTDTKWDDMTRPFIELQKKLEKEQPDYQKPDPECPSEDDGCGGTGSYASQYNPNSKWDWYQVGGRWAGYFKLKTGAEGVRGENGLMESSRSDDGVDITTVGEIDFDAMGEDWIPFAVLHEGKWYERGDMGWWGMVSDEKDPKEWETQVAKLIKELPEDTGLTVVDCHI